jgi:hypothetical protein
MSITCAPLILAIAFMAGSPPVLSAQGGAAKGAAAPKNAAATPARPAAQQTPTPAPQTPAPAAKQTAATERAKCKDGTVYAGASRKGACSSHGGVTEWLTTAKGAAPKGATARCNDGTFYSKAERQGACTGHKGVAEWLKKS